MSTTTVSKLATALKLSNEKLMEILSHIPNQNGNTIMIIEHALFTDISIK